MQEKYQQQQEKNKSNVKKVIATGEE